MTPEFGNRFLGVVTPSIEIGFARHSVGDLLSVVVRNCRWLRRFVVVNGNCIWLADERVLCRTWPFRQSRASPSPWKNRLAQWFLFTFDTIDVTSEDVKESNNNLPAYLVDPSLFDWTIYSTFCPFFLNHDGASFLCIFFWLIRHFLQPPEERYARFKSLRVISLKKVRFFT